MYGIVTRHEEELEWETFDRGVYEVKSPDGQMREPAAAGTNLLSCFADESAARGDPELVPVTADGEPATSDRSEFGFGYVCPSRSAYREGLLAMIADCADASPDVRLDDVGFPDRGYCHCSVCETAFGDSDVESRDAWRAGVITSFLRSAAERVPGRVSVSVQPDPYPGHLLEKSGLDLEAIAGLLDEIVVPLYDPSYETTYWLAAIADAFADRIATLDDLELGIELFAAEAGVDALLKAMAAVEPFADAIYLGYDSSTARAALRRKRAEDRPGRSHG